jgi:hypothetical protein
MLGPDGSDISDPAADLSTANAASNMWIGLKRGGIMWFDVGGKRGFAATSGATVPTRPWWSRPAVCSPPGHMMMADQPEPLVEALLGPGLFAR